MFLLIYRRRFLNSGELQKHSSFLFHPVEPLRGKGTLFCFILQRHCMGKGRLHFKGYFLFFSSAHFDSAFLRIVSCPWAKSSFLAPTSTNQHQILQPNEILKSNFSIQCEQPKLQVEKAEGCLPWHSVTSSLDDFRDRGLTLIQRLWDKIKAKENLLPEFSFGLTGWPVSLSPAPANSIS